MKLTKHFSLDEFTRSATAQANGVDNTLDMTKTNDRIVVENLEHLCQTVLEPLREQMGMPVVISSGYRCRELNSLVGGVWNSQHLTGEAADIQPLWDVETRHATSLPSPIFQRDSTVPPPFGRESVDIRWRIGRGTPEAKPPFNFQLTIDN